MFHWLNRILNYFAILVICLYVADWFYPFTRQKLTQTIKPEIEPYLDWINIGISLFAALALFGLALMVISLALAILEALIDRASLEHSQNYYMPIAKHFFWTGGCWVIYPLFFLNYVHISGPVSFWEDLFLGWLEHPYVLAVTKFVFAAIVWILKAVVVILIVAAILAVVGFVISYKDEITRFTKSLFKKKEKEEA